MKYSMGNLTYRNDSRYRSRYAFSYGVPGTSGSAVVWEREVQRRTEGEGGRFNGYG